MLLDRDTFGSTLRNAREQQGVTLQQVAAATGIQAELWRDFERSDVTLWPDHLVTADAVRGYAGAVGLNPDIIGDQFSRLFPVRGDRVESLLRAHASLVHEID